MAIPAALTEGAGDKMLPLVYDNAGTNAAAAWRSIVTRTINGSPLGHVGVGTHPDAATWAAQDPIVVMGGVDNTTVRKLAVDASGRLIGRPVGIYDAGGGANGYGYPRLISGVTLNGERYGWTGVASHEDGATWAAPGGVVVIGALDGTTVRKMLGDSAGRLRTFEDFTLAGTGHAEVTVGGTQVALRAASTPFRRIQIVADADNTVPIYFGITGVTANENATTGGYRVNASSALAWTGAAGSTANLNQLFINATAAAGVSFIYWT